VKTLSDNVCALTGGELLCFSDEEDEELNGELEKTGPNTSVSDHAIISLGKGFEGTSPWFIMKVVNIVFSSVTTVPPPVYRRISDTLSLEKISGVKRARITGQFTSTWLAG
jgi:hypothetical protein